MLQKSFCCINHAYVCIYACFIDLVITKPCHSICTIYLYGIVSMISNEEPALTDREWSQEFMRMKE